MKWEYKTVKIEAKYFDQPVEELFDVDIALNQFGSEGGDLVSSLDTNKNQGQSKEIILFFKRPLVG
jgi:hypothetical protein